MIQSGATRARMATEGGALEAHGKIHRSKTKRGGADMKLKAFVAALAVVMVVAIGADLASAACRGKAPFNGYKVAPPSADVPEKWARFSGVWDGPWQRGLCSTVAVEHVSSDGTVRVVYATGSSKDTRGRNIPGGYVRAEGIIDTSGTLIFTIHTPNNPTRKRHDLSYRFVGDKLAGVSNKGASFGTFTKRER